MLLNQIKIQNEKVKRFLVLESDFGVNVIGKMLFFITVLPHQISLMRIHDSEYPDDELNLYYNRMNLHDQIEQNASMKVLESF